MPIENELLVYIHKHLQYIKVGDDFATNNQDLFLNINNTPYKSYDSITKFWQNALTALGIDYRKPYFMRHTFACLMLDKQVNPKIISTILGHVDLTMLLKTYGNKTLEKDAQESFLNLKKSQEVK